MADRERVIQDLHAVNEALANLRLHGSHISDDRLKSYQITIASAIKWLVADEKRIEQLINNVNDNFVR